MKVVKYILLLLFSIEFCGIAMGGSYITKSSTSPGYKFEESTSWNNNSMPGSYNSITKKFSAIGNSDIEVNGYVGLSGSLDIGNDVFLSGSQLTIKKNSIFVIDGDLIISDRVDVVIEEGATLYITGNLITENKSDIWSYVQMDIKKNANIVVEGNVTSTNDANIAVNFENGNNSDFYVFGSISGDVYRQIGSTIVGTPKYKSDGTSKIDNEQQYNKDETALNNTVENIITEVINGCKTINVPAGKTVKISTPTEPICNIVMGDNKSQLIIESSGVLNLSQDVTISKGIVTNYGKIISENDLDHSWFKEGESIPILKPANSPVKENDVACNGCTMQANNVSLEECMNGTLKLLGIEDDPFIPKNKELHFLYDFNPCSKEFETSKVRIRELSNKWFRSINGQLYYCEGDNE